MHDRDSAQLRSLQEGRGFLRGILKEEVETLRCVPKDRQCKSCRSWDAQCAKGVKVLDSVTGALRAPAADFGCVMWEAK